MKTFSDWILGSLRVRIGALPLVDKPSDLSNGEKRKLHVVKTHVARERTPFETELAVSPVGIQPLASDFSSVMLLTASDVLNSEPSTESNIGSSKLEAMPALIDHKP